MAAAVDNVEQQVKSTAKGLDGFIKSNRAKAEGFVSEFRGRIEKSVADVKKVATENLEKVKNLFKKGGSVERAKAVAEKAVEDGKHFTEETINKLGLAKIADVSALKDAFDALAKKLEALKKKVDGLGKGASSEAAKAPESGVKE